MYRCESWTIKKAECQRMDAFKLWCRRRLLRVSWTQRQPRLSSGLPRSPSYTLDLESKVAPRPGFHELT